MSGQTTLRRKIRAPLIGLGVAITVAALALASWDYFSFRSAMVEDLQMVADQLAKDCGEPLLAKQKDGVSKALEGLPLSPRVDAACIYGPDKKVSAHYAGPGRQAEFPDAPESGHRFASGQLSVFHPIVTEGMTVGTAYVRTNLDGLNRKLIRNSLAAGAFLVLSAVLLFVVNLRLNTEIVDPISALAETEKRVVDEEDFSYRAEQDGGLEIGSLVSSFNALLESIGQVTKGRGEANSALQLSEDRIQSILAAAVDGIVITDSERVITSANPSAERIFGYDSGEMKGLPLDDLFVDTEVNTQFLGRSLPGKSRPSRAGLEAIGIRDNGAKFPLELSSSKFQEGEQKNYVCIFRDISARKDAEVRLEKLNRRLVEASRYAGMAEVATGVLHNVGNVLNSVNVSANLAKEQLKQFRVEGLVRGVNLLRDHEDDLADFLTNSEQGKYFQPYMAELAEFMSKQEDKLHHELNALIKNVDHIKEIVAMQQSYAKLAGVTQEVSPADLMDDAYNMSMADLVKKGITTERQTDTDLPLVKVDKHKVLQILINLLNNARDSLAECTADHKRVCLRVYGADKGRVYLEVEDNGKGILKEDLVRIFAHGFTTREKGHGFGLHVSALSAREMGGEIKVESDGPSKGAKFTLVLPGVPAKKPASASSSAKAVGS